MSTPKWKDLGAVYVGRKKTHIPLIRVESAPLKGQYCFDEDRCSYEFSSHDEGRQVAVSYASADHEGAKTVWFSPVPIVI